MYDYHIGLAWEIDKLLFVISLIISLFVILYTSIHDLFKKIRARQLALLKKKLEDTAASAKGVPIERCNLLISKMAALEIVDILKEREPSLPKELQLDLRACFVAEGKIAEIKKIASHPGNKWRRIHSIISLGYSKDASILPILKDGLLDKDEDVSYFSMLALGRIKSAPAAGILLDYLSGHIHSGQEVASILESFSPIICDEVVKLTNNPGPKVRFWAVKILSKLKPHQHIKKITELLKDGSADVRAASCECLGEIGSPEDKTALRDCLKDQVWFVKMHAVRALHKILGPLAIPEVIPLIRDNNWLIRDSVKQALKAHIDASLPSIEELMRASEDQVKADCIEVLEESGFLEALFKDIFSQDEKLRQKSRQILEKSIIHPRAHLGLESIIGGLSEDRQKEIFKIIADINKPLAEHIEAKIKGRIAEA